MINSYAEWRLHPDDVTLFREIERKLRHVRIDDSISCHVVATAVRDRWPQLKLVHGKFMVSWEHSWLVTPHGNIVDAYPIACVGGPLLIDGHCGPWVLFSKAYEETDTRYAVDPALLSIVATQL